MRNWPVFFSLFWTALCLAAPPSASDISWPLGRNGKERILLRIPASYGHWNQSAEAADKALYPEGHRQYNGQTHEELLLLALWPGLVPDHETNRAEFEVAGGGSRITALIHSAAIEDFDHHKYSALQSAFDIAIDFSTKMLCVAPYEQVNKSQDAKAICYSRDVADTKPPKFGLQRLGVDFAKYPDIPEAARHDMMENGIYFARNQAGELTTVITCMAEEAKTSDDSPQYKFVPQCTQHFVSRRLNALVSLNYRRKYLQDWVAIQAQWEALLDSWVVPAQSTHN
jgi:hypothetical protein